MVGAKGFEPSTSWSRTRRASQAALRPECYSVLLSSLRGIGGICNHCREAREAKQNRREAFAPWRLSKELNVLKLVPQGELHRPRIGQ